MEQNKFDALFSDAPAPQQKTENQYDVLFNEPSLKQSTFVGVQKDPVRYADVLKLSQELSVPSSFVETNFEALKKRRDAYSIEPTLLTEDYPGLKSWMQNPDNSAISHDDIEPLKGMERSVQSFSTLRSLGSDLRGGILSAMKMGAEVPAFLRSLAVDVAQNEGTSFEGVPAPVKPVLKEPYRVPESFINNPVARALEDEANYWFEQSEFRGQGNLKGLNELLDGNIANGALILASNFARQAPLTAGIIAASVVGGPVGAAAGLGAAGLMQSGETFRSDVNRGVDQDIARNNAAIQGLVEVVSEKIGLDGIMGAYASSLRKTLGSQTAKEAFSAWLVNMGKASGVGGVEEWVASIGQDLSAYFTGADESALDGIFRRGVESFIGGFVQGGAFSSPSIAQVPGQIKRSEQNKDLYRALGAGAEASKVKERLPSAMRTYVESVTQGGPVENIYISAEGFDTYFQKEDVPPVTAAKEIGISKAYDEAKEAGTPIQIPLSVWVEKVAGTPAYEGLQDDIKFSPEELTANEEKLEAERVETADVETQITEEVEDPVLALRERFKEQAAASGLIETEAEANAALYEERLRRRADIRGESPEQLAADQNLTVQAGTAPIENPEEHVLNQAEIFDFGIYKKMKDLQKELQEEAAKQAPSEPLSPIESLKARLGNDKIAIRSIDKAQRKDGGSYVSDKKIKGLGFAPNYLSEPTGVIGKPEIQGLNKDGRDIDPLSWLDSKYKATKRLIEKHSEKGIPLTINTSSDLIGTDDYIESLPQGTTVNFYVTPENGERVREGSAFSFNREVFKSLPSRKRQFTAVQRLRDAGVSVNVIEPTADTVIKFSGGIKKLAKILGVSESNALAEVRRAADPKLLKGFGTQENTFFQTKQKSFNAVTPEEFISARDKSTRKQFLTPYTAEELKDYQLFMTDDGVGYALSPSMDMIGVFNNSGRPGAGREAIVDGISRGAKTLDAVGGYLPEYYNQFGFVESRRVSWDDQYAPEGWNYEKYGRPDIVFMEYPESLSRDSAEVRSRTQLARNQLERPSDSTGQSNVFPEIDGQIDWAAWGRLDSTEQSEALRRAGIDSESVVYQNDSTEILGQAQIGLNQNIISLFKNANPSTLPHELSHVWLNEFKNDVSFVSAKDPETLTPTQKQFLKDSETVLNFLEVDSWEKVGRDQQEKWAKAFEAYLMEGKAPSKKLRGVFDQFKRWLTRIYQTVKNIGVEINPEISAVFDRLLASEQATTGASLEQNYQPIFVSREASGMNDQQWDRYVEAQREAVEFAENTLENEMLDDLRKKQTKEYKERREVVKNQVTKEANESLVYNAISILQKGVMADGSELPDGFYPFKLSRDGIDSEYKGNLPRGIFDDKNGITSDAAAELLGFSSGDDLLNNMANAEPKAEFIERETEEKMKLYYPDLYESPRVPEEAMKAVHNESRARVLRMELEHLASENLPALKDVMRSVTRRPASNEFVKAQAKRIIGTKPIREIKPSMYLQAERRHAKQAGEFLAQGDIRSAFESKEKELLNHELYRAAIHAKENSTKMVRYLNGFNKDSKRAQLGLAGHTYLDQIDSILERFDFKRSVTLKELDRRQSLQKFIDQQTEEGLPPELSAAVQRGDYRKNYKDLPYAELEGIYDSVKNIDHLARLKNKLMANQDYKDFSEAVGKAAVSIQENAKGKKKKDPETRLPGQELYKIGAGFLASHRKVSSLVREMDGFKDGGVMWELFSRPMNEAGDKEASMNKEATKALTEIFDVYSLKDVRGFYTKKKIPELGEDVSLTKAALLSIALNQGNLDNKTKLRDGYQYTQLQIDRALDAHLDKRDWDFVQNIWDYVDTFWPETSALNKRVTGLPAEKVQASSVKTKYGTYKGGYYPIKYDSLQSPKAYANSAKEMADKTMRGGFIRSTTKNGHRKERVESTGQPIRLDLGVIFEHVSQVIHDQTHYEFLIDANRLLRNKDIQDSIINYYGQDVFAQMRDALNDVAAGDIPARLAFEKGLNYLRKGSTIAGLGWNLTTALFQPAGLTQSMVRVGPQWVAKGIKHWIGDAFRLENTTKMIYEKSPFMRNRGDTQQREINEIRNTARGGSFFDFEVGDKKVGLSDLQDSYFYLIQKMQQVADIPTWLGAYEKAMAENALDEKRAVALADQAVLDSQGGGQIKDLAAIQRGGPLLKLWTNFYSFFNTRYNLTAESFKRTDWKSPLSIGRLGVDMLLLYTIPYLIISNLRAALQGKMDDEEYWRKYISQLPEQMSADVLSNFLFAREVASAVQGYKGYEGPAGASFFSKTGKFINQAQQGELDEAFFRALNQAGGVLLHYPAGQLERFARGADALSEGKSENPLILITGPEGKNK